jgi:predicted NUDIX family NTP pyrophosphohydrolase
MSEWLDSALLDAERLTTYRAAIIVLHRPYLLQKMHHFPPGEKQSWQALSQGKAKTAAANINVLLERLINLDMIRFLKPLT